MPFEKTLQTLEDIKNDDTNLPAPELYVILNGVPTKKRIIWRTLVNINNLRAAITKLKDINWLYSSVDDSSLDEVARQVIEVSNDTTSTLIEEATPEDIASFQSYTIRGLDDKLSTESDVSQYKMNHIRENPIDSRQNHLDVMCFPTLFPTGQFGENHYRPVKLSQFEYVKSRLLNKDSRYRKCPQYVFYLLWQKEIRELKGGIYNVLNTSKFRDTTVSALLNDVNNSDLVLESNLTTMLQSIRGTKQYWFMRKSDLDCMVREWGSPTFFCTFSCAEYESPDIIEYLRKVNNVPDSYDNGRLCTEDPISVSRQFSHKFHQFFNIVINKGGVLGPVEHFYWKKEYQQRGAPHYHVLLWIRDAPTIGKDDPQKIVSFIDERITCHIPNKESCPELHKLVTSKQLHNCSAYCRRKYKSGRIFFQRCKFGFPRPVASCTKLKDVSANLKAHQKICDLKRNEAEVRVNDYNPLLLLLWKANIDIQFVSESSLALAHYVTGYVTKAEKSNMQDIWQEISDNKSVYSRLFSFGVKCLCSRECGLYEASDLLLGDHLHEKSVTVQWVSVAMPKDRKRRLKKYSDLQQLAATDPDSDNVYCDNLYNTYYPQRPAALEDVCLYDFVANYDYYTKDKNGDRKYPKLKKPRLPNHWLYDPLKEDEKEKYYYSLVLLFVPFRDEASLLQNNETAEEAFNRLLSNDQSANLHHEKLQKMLQARTRVRDIDEAREGAVVDPEEDEGPDISGEAIAAMQDIADLKTSDSTMTLEERESMLNVDQKRIFNNIKRQLLHQIEHETGNCSCHGNKPFTMFVSGVGGTGKSFLIATVKALIDSLWKTEDITCAIAAPTGLAAFNVGGITLHRLFRLPVEHDSRGATYWRLRPESQKIMRTKLRNLKLVIVDEVSMVSSLNLTYMHMRLEELFNGGDKYFGAKNVLLVGDILQLPPVNEKPVFDRVSQKAILHKLGSTTAIKIWQEVVVYDELTINERQKTDTKFSEMLDSVRCGFPTEETVRALKERVITGSIYEKYHELEQQGKTPVCLFPTRLACHEFNTQMLNSLNTPIQEMKCSDTIDESSSSRKWTKRADKKLEELNKDCNNTAGLESTLTLAVGARVMLRSNIDTKAGLVNGAIGTVLAITSKRVSVKFDNIDKPYDVEKVSRKFTILKNFDVFRKQFPLILAFAMTIHKCQGLSLDSAIIDLSDKIFDDGMAYVALSRLRTLSGVHLVDFDPKSIEKVSIPSLKELNRLRNLYRQDLPQYVIPDRKPTKRKLTGTTDIDYEPPSKRSNNVLSQPCTQPRRSARIADKSSSNNVGQRAPTKRSASPSFQNKKSKKPCPPHYDNASNKPKKQDSKKDDKAKSLANKPQSSNDDGAFMINEALSTPRNSGLSRYDNSRVWPYEYNPVQTDWQRATCRALGLQFVRSSGTRFRGPNVPLKRPNFQTCISIRGDGNCFFRAIAHAITGSQQRHKQLRAMIIDHMRTYSFLFVHCLNVNEYDIDASDTLATIDSYLRNTQMARDRTWATEIEIYAMAYLLRTSIFLFNDPCRCGVNPRRRCTCNPTAWTKISWASVLRLARQPVPHINDSAALYLYHPTDHFELVKDIID